MRGALPWKGHLALSDMRALTMNQSSVGKRLRNGEFMYQVIGLSLCDKAIRKLPRISPALTVTVPNSDPRQHQGRIRSFPHVEGQFAAFVYIPLILSTNRKLFDLLRKAVEKANEIVPELMCDWSENEVCELHISLTRPIYIRHHQREELKRAVRSIARSNHP